MQVQTISTPTTGRFLVEGPSAPRSILFSFHGYAENAEENLAQVRRIPRGDTRLVVAIQALHWFYRMRTQEVVASWMTPLERQQAIANNIAYVRSIVEQVRDAHAGVPFFFAGFSQGAAMAWRAAAAIPGSAGVIILGGDLPRGITEPATLPPILLGRGSADDWYTLEKYQNDLERLRDARVETCEFDGGHEWGEAFLERVARFLEAREV